jgi:beta-phosphoglucomutase
VPLVNLAAIIFDVDGVLVDSPHEHAWQETLAELMSGPWADVLPETTYSPEKFDTRLYQSLVAGKPRMSGALAILEHFHVPWPTKRAVSYAHEKQIKVTSLIDAGRFGVFPDAIRFVLDCKHLGFRIAAASSSKNARRLLASIQVQALDRNTDACLHDLFDADVSGRPVAHGKPHPDIFLAAANELGVPQNDCVVVEDAVVGIMAAKAGGMRAIGVARLNDETELQAAHADLVVTSLDNVSRQALARYDLESEPTQFAA